MQPFGNEGMTVKAVPEHAVRDEFYKSYPADNQEAKKKAYQRALLGSRDKELIGSREIGGIDHLWMANKGQ